MTGHTGELRHCDTEAVRPMSAPDSLRKHGAPQVNWLSSGQILRVDIEIGLERRRPSILEGQPSVIARRKDRGD